MLLGRRELLLSSCSATESRLGIVAEGVMGERAMGEEADAAAGGGRLGEAPLARLGEWAAGW